MEIPALWIKPGVEVLEEARDCLRSLHLFLEEARDVLEHDGRGALAELQHPLESLGQVLEGVRTLLDREVDTPPATPVARQPRS